LDDHSRRATGRSSNHEDELDQPRYSSCFEEVQLIDEHELANRVTTTHYNFSVSAWIAVGHRYGLEQIGFTRLLPCVRVIPMQQRSIPFECVREKLVAALIVDSDPGSNDIFQSSKSSRDGEVRIVEKSNRQIDQSFVEQP